MERLFSGKKINSAADDAAGFAIGKRMTTQIRGLNMAKKNINDSLSMLAVVENASSEVSNMFQRIRELAVQAASDCFRLPRWLPRGNRRRSPAERRRRRAAVAGAAAARARAERC